MSAIRPLATLAILAVLGVFLALKINKEPLAPTASADGEWGEGAAYESAGGEAPAFGAPSGGEAGDAPAFESQSAPALAPPTMPTDPPMPEFPAIPPLPTDNPAIAGPPPMEGEPMAGPPAPAGPTAVDPSALNLPDLPMPDSIPQASYPDSQSASDGVDGPAVTGRVPSLGTATSDYPPTAGPPTDAGPAYPSTPPAYGAYPETSPPTYPSTAEATPPATPDASEVLPGSLPAAPAPSGYATARPAIQAALDRNELARAHVLLTNWYADPSLLPEERREVDRLLGQLAGTVIYSTEHRLEPPHQVQAGETLETIAKQYGTTWQLLAKINGVASSDGVQAGQMLKVIRGPFEAVVDLSEAELYLTVGGRYAGRFPVTVNEASTPEGQYKVTGKLAQYRPGSPAAGPQGYAKSLTLGGGARTPLSVGVVGGSEPIAVVASDMGDLFDILSEGSQVTVRK
ncbi:MAG: LysM peptidoglycan-binding domain-containing protein [Planctomycetota bacterium]